MTTREDPIEAAVGALERGEVVALPTETVYGLAADASNPDAIERLFELKGRPNSVPLPLAVAAVEWVPDWASVDDPRLERLARRWWPGPLTVVLPARDEVSRVLTGGRATIAVRVPDQEQARAVIARFGRAVALTSANVHGEPEARSADEVAATFGLQVAAIVDGGPSSIGEPSTIVALVDSEAPKILRRGALSESQVLEALK
ncbi:MAG: threonylcarbamoyl-AMP synthase [Deltaproteobacteria bacterium]|nr:threonylcarbamoyl-AMP synthase [Deltaproteobacteria bacterium]